MANRRLLCATLGFATLLSVGCDDRSGRTQRVPEAFSLVPGVPQAESGTPKVLVDDTRATGTFRASTPQQCDLYQQLSVRKVDILWVVDSSGSMAVKQQRLAANFQGFMNQLVNANPPIDFHIGVISTDTDDPGSRGVLRNWALGNSSGNFIECVPNATGGSSCNTGTTSDAVQAFRQMVTVGISGSAVERGLYAMYLALTNRNNTSSPGNPQFIRPEASLYVVVVSDEDDTSCNPLVEQKTTCTADPGCRCVADSVLSGTTAGVFGSTTFFTRFLETYKGFGNGDRVTLAAIVATEGALPVPSQFGDPNTHVGCCRTTGGGACPTSGSNDGTYEIAYFGERYIKVATETGGAAVSICDSDFSGALTSLGYAASGLRRDFRLTRGPRLQDGRAVDVYVSKPTALTCQVDGNCPAGESCRSRRCAKRTTLTSTPATGVRYERCSGSVLRNSVRFDEVHVPVSLSAVEVCYDVDPEFETTCP